MTNELRNYKIIIEGQSTPSVSPTGKGTIYFDSSTNHIYFSENGSSYQPMGTSSGTVTGSGSSGQVAFWNGSSSVGGNSNFFWDNTNKRLGVGTNSVLYPLEVRSQSGNQVWLNLANSDYNGTSIGTSFIVYAGAASGNTSVVIDTLNAGTTAAGILNINPSGGSIAFTGNITKIHNVITSFPSSQGSANTFLKNDGSGNLTWNQVSLTTGVTGVLPIANGGTNSSTALNNNRLIQSAGGEIVEASTLINTSFGNLVLGTTNNAADFNGSGTIKNFVFGYNDNNTSTANDLGVVVRNASTTTNSTTGLHFSAASGSSGSNDFPIFASIVGSAGARTSGQYSVGTLHFLLSQVVNTAPVEVMTILPSGNVGIGTTNPSVLLEVNGNALIDGYIESNQGNFAGTIYFGGSSSARLASASSSSLLSINPDGYGVLALGNSPVGIGTSSLSSSDQVGASRVLTAEISDSSTTVAGSTATIVISNSNTTTNNTSAIAFAAQDGSSNRHIDAEIGSIHGVRTSTQYQSGDMFFATSNTGNSAPAEKMRLTHDGKLGIATTSPTSLFSVGSSSQFQVDSNGNLIKLNNVTQSWPSSQGAASTFLQNDGSGNLTWVTPTITTPTTQIFTSGSGTYTTPAGVKWIEVELVGGGGGGGGSASSPGSGQNGGSGGDTTFGSSFLTGHGGTGSSFGGGAPAGGTATGGDVNIQGGNGSAGTGATILGYSPIGGGSILGFGGAGGDPNNIGNPASGYGGAGSTSILSTAAPLPGASGGGYCRKIVGSPSGSYTYSVGSGGTGGSAGSGGHAGGAGAGGIIIVKEYYNNGGGGGGGGSGTVTSVAMTVPSFLSVSGSPITTSGTLTVTLSGTALPIANGGTGQTTASAAFNALSPITSTGDLILGNGTNSATRLAIGTNNYVLTSNGTTASWQPAGAGSSDTFARNQLAVVSWQYYSGF